ncbi:MAG: hypothetical protein ACHQ8D_01095 [Candidatus Rokuibacteriota bacterium]
MGATKRTLTRWVSILALPAILGFPGPARSGEREVAGMVTEIHPGEGQVEVRSAETERWRPAMPLLTLREGDTVNTTQDAWAVIVLTGGRGSVRVDEANAPFSVTAPPGDRSRLHKGLKILEASFNFLSTTPRELPLGTLGTRAGTKPPAILTPRNSLVLPDSLVFEWRGSRSSLVTIRVVGPQGLVLERTNLAAARFQYPRNAPPLLAGVRYRFQLLPAWSPPQEVWFELIDPFGAQAIRQELQDLDEALAAAPPPPATLAALRAGVLAGHGLLHDARLGLAEELVRHPDEPTLHFLLGDLYARQGLPEEAAESFAEARLLMSAAAPGR